MKHRIILFSFLSLALILTRATSSEAQQASTVHRAQELHGQGVSLFQAGRYREAAALFEQAEQLAPDPLNSYNQARCYQELGEFGSALRALDRYLASPDISAGDRVSAQRLRQELVAAQGRATPTPQPVQPQPVQLYAPQPVVQQTPQVQSTTRVAIAPWVIFGAGMAVVLAGGALDIAAYANSQQEEVFDSMRAYNDWYDGTTTLALVGDILLGVGGAAAVAGLIWGIIDLTRGRSRAASTGSVRIALTPTTSGGVFFNSELRF